MSALPPPPPPPPPRGPSVPPYGGPPPYGPGPGVPYESPYGRGANYPYAGFGARLGGHLLDGLLYGLLTLPFAIPSIVLGFAAFRNCNVTEYDSTGHRVTTCGPGQFNGWALAGAILLGFAAFVVIAVVYVRALGRTGQTWGRKIVGVKVVGIADGQPLGVGRALGRCLAEWFVSGNCILGYLWMLWDDQKQTWHDKIVSSVVVRV